MDPFVGELRLVAFDYAPPGWLLANGALFNVNQYSALYSLFQNTFGGVPGRTFGVPNLQGNVVVGAGQITPQFNYPLGQFGGVPAVTLTPSQVPSHSHSLMVSAAKGGLAVPGGNALSDAKDAPGNLYVSNAPASTTTAMSPAAVSTYSGGGSQPHDNMMPFLTLNWIVAWQGVFPQRP